MNFNFFTKFINDERPFEDKDIINKLSISTAHDIYRNGPVEDMHAMGKLLDSDMKVLNKLIVNRLAYIFTILLDKEKLDEIKSRCNNDDVDLKLCNAAMIYIFEEGYLKQDIVKENLQTSDLVILYNHMRKELREILKGVIERDENMVKTLKLSTLIYGANWDYAIPEDTEFDEFLSYL